MSAMNEVNGAGRERAILVGVYEAGGSRVLEEESLDELAELVSSAGARVVTAFLQERRRLDPATLVGRGKLEEVAAAAASWEADVVVFDRELSPAQLRNLEKALETKVVDRSELILDIFAQRARSREGKLQVELAQLEYLLPRLTGKGTALSRLGGGIGTRGPGETKLEVDRRTIRTRIARVRRELGRLEKRRALQRAKRKGVPIPTVSLVGYTNAGKSTLFNQLTEAGTPAGPRMFATLDPLVRRIDLPSGLQALVSDTVGFVRRLPHALVAAFHATLEEALEADLILHVIDASHPASSHLVEAVYGVLEEIGFGDTPVIEAYNKIDLLPQAPRPDTSRPWLAVSALTGEGIDALREALEAQLTRSNRLVELCIPFERGDVVSELRERARVEAEEYAGDGIHLRVALTSADLNRYREFLEVR